MVIEEEVSQILEDCDKEGLTTATVCSYPNLQIFDGARKEEKFDKKVT